MTEEKALNAVEKAIDLAFERGKELSINNVMPILFSIDFKKLRKTKGLTLVDVENLTGISNSYLIQLEANEIKDPSYCVVRTLYDLYVY